jgi:GGDEF domain-containing protein
VLLLNLDHSKDVNNWIGCEADGRLLRIVVRRLPDSVREGDTLASAVRAGAWNVRSRNHRGPLDG